MTLKTVMTAEAPAPIGPYSQAVWVENFLFCSGQIPLNPTTMELVSDDIKKQTEQVFKNIQAVCNAAGTDLKSIFKLTIFLTDLTHFPIVNEIMTKFLSEPFPARSTVQVSALPKGAKVEIEAIALR